MMPICYKNRRKKKMAIVYRPPRSESKENMSARNEYDTPDELRAPGKRDWTPK